MSKDQEPKEYQFKHSRRISMDSYNGVAGGIMELNDPIADGFMRVADMRSDVVIIQKPQERVRDYDEIGFVRVAKVLKLPRLDFWRDSNDLTQTKKEDDIWYIAINDQDLADRVARAEGDNRKFNERFVDAFQAEVRNGLATCLRREKLLNSGKYNFGFLVAYHGLLNYDLLLAPVAVVTSILSGDPMSAAKVALLIAIANSTWNTFNLAGAGMTYLEDKIFGAEGAIKPSTPNFNDPFIRHSVFDLVMPPVPIDRLVRGSRYLTQHGGQLITIQSHS